MLVAITVITVALTVIIAVSLVIKFRNKTPIAASRTNIFSKKISNLQQIGSSIGRIITFGGGICRKKRLQAQEVKEFDLTATQISPSASALHTGSAPGNGLPLFSSDKSDVNSSLLADGASNFNKSKTPKGYISNRRGSYLLNETSQELITKYLAQNVLYYRNGSKLYQPNGSFSPIILVDALFRLACITSKQPAREILHAIHCPYTSNTPRTSVGIVVDTMRQAQPERQVASSEETTTLTFHPVHYQRYMYRVLKMVGDTIYHNRKQRESGSEEDDAVAREHLPPPRRRRSHSNWKNSLILCLEDRNRVIERVVTLATPRLDSNNNREEGIVEALRDKGIIVAYSRSENELPRDIEATIGLEKGMLERLFKSEERNIEESPLELPSPSTPTPRFISSLSTSLFECYLGNSNCKSTSSSSSVEKNAAKGLLGMFDLSSSPAYGKDRSAKRVGITRMNFRFIDYIIPVNGSRRPITLDKSVKFVLIPPPRVIRFFYCYFDHTTSLPVTTTEGTKQNTLCLELPLDSDCSMCLRILMPTKIGFFDVLPQEVANTFAQWDDIFRDDVANTETADGSQFAILVPEFSIPFSQVKLDKILESMDIKTCFDRSSTKNFEPLTDSDDGRGFYINHLAQLIKFDWKPAGLFPNAQNDPNSFITQIKRSNHIILSRAFYFNVVFRVPDEKEVSERKETQDRFPKGNYISVYTGYLTDPSAS